MIYPLPPDQSYYRVTILGRRWRDVLSGRGALYLPATGNRYNTVLQQAAYVADEPAVAVTEFAYYAARSWQEQTGAGYLPPPLEGISSLPPLAPLVPGGPGLPGGLAATGQRH